MKRFKLLFVLLLWLGNLANANAKITQVHVSAGDVGQGFLVERLDQCFLVTPEHVVKDELFGNLIGGTDLRSRGEAYPVQTFGYDLTLMVSSGALNSECGIAFSGLPTELPNLVSGASRLSVSSVNSDGSSTVTPANLLDSDLLYLTIDPSHENMIFAQGMSGSLVFFEDTPVGMLQSVDAATGQGRVLRMDRLTETLKPFFGASAGVVKFEAAQAKDEIGSVDLGSSRKAVPLQLVSWSHEPIAGTRASFAIDNDKTTEFRMALYDASPVMLEFFLGDELVEFSEVKIVSLVKEGTARIRDFEILTARTSEGRRGWRSLHSGTMLPNESEKLISLVPSGAKRMTLVIRSTWSEGSELTLNELTLF
ncbi:hypothetical protein [Pseudidiomarina insulisalsae]|uniref:Serine protease n=1 Tax=Pseudidiomarina insulisalsae TaxID=575789 RepID=A0A432YLM8_9GAMM|nr:hypothetical protein [Pseudidiomarina insulisalsae]RUO61798.1 hypothetical protein CWI71_05405 [Pseudidiomarina insulisalsae]